VPLTAVELDRVAGELLHLATEVHLRTSIDALAQELTAHEDWADVVSERDVADRLESIANDLRLETLPEHSHVRAELRKFADEVEGWDDTEVVYLAISGVALPDGEVRIGEWLVRPLSEEARREAAAAVEALAARWEMRAESRTAFLASWLNTLERWSAERNHVLLEIEIKASPRRAVELAAERRSELVDLLRVYSLATFSRQHRVAIGIPGEVAFGLDDVWAISKQTSRFASSTKALGPIQPFLLTTELAGELSEGDFAFIPVIDTSPSERSEMEERLLLALHWIADSAVQLKPANQLLSLFTALETLLVTRRSGITRNLSETMAFLLEDELEGRRYVLNSVQALYSGRGEVTHAGLRDVPADDVAWLTDATLGIAQRLLRRRDELTTAKALAEWVETQRLS
jgi:hypothetical protein